MREALSIIAELRDSVRLRQFLETGTDRQLFSLSLESVLLTSLTAGEIIPATRSDLPRGLNQLGNTCYLNSLLQVIIFKYLRSSSSEFGITVFLYDQRTARSSCTYGKCGSSEVA